MEVPGEPNPEIADMSSLLSELSSSVAAALTIDGMILLVTHDRSSLASRESRIGTSPLDASL
jgi:hypothetical protein